VQLGPPEGSLRQNRGIDWSDIGLGGSTEFLSRVILARVDVILLISKNVSLSMNSKNSKLSVTSAKKLRECNRSFRITPGSAEHRHQNTEKFHKQSRTSNRYSGFHAEIFRIRTPNDPIK
jgi:hypothetical protein